MTDTITSAAGATVDTLLADYMTFWNETDDAARATVADRTFTGEVTYVDPQVDLDGRTALTEHVAAVHAALPGMAFSRGGFVDAHHDVVRFSWHLGPAERPDLIKGFDVARLSPEGRLTAIVGFIDEMPQG